MNLINLYCNLSHFNLCALKYNTTFTPYSNNLLYSPYSLNLNLIIITVNRFNFITKTNHLQKLYSNGELIITSFITEIIN